MNVAAAVAKSCRGAFRVGAGQNPCDGWAAPPPAALSRVAFGGEYAGNLAGGCALFCESLHAGKGALLGGAEYQRAL